MSDREERITLEHGSGGWLSRELTEEVIHPFFRSEAYSELLDAACFELSGQAFLTTDTYVVDPPFFPGGDIGRLAVFGTCNDLAVAGAEPRGLSLGLILEEGLPLPDLKRALASARAAADEAGVRVLTGDTKVVPAGKGGGIFINTTGVGAPVRREAMGQGAGGPLLPHPGRIREGDAVLVSAPIGAHGLAVLAARESLSVAAGLSSDCALLLPVCRGLLSLGEDLRFMRDATRGGVSAVLNETCRGRPFGIEVVEEHLPVDGRVAAISDLLGLEPLEVANEGVLVAVVAGRALQRALEILWEQPLGRRAAAVGRTVGDHPGRVVLETRIGGRRILDFPRGLLLPRIC